MFPPPVAPEAFKSPLVMAPELVSEISPPLPEVELELRLDVVSLPLVALRSIAPPFPLLAKELILPVVLSVRDSTVMFPPPVAPEAFKSPLITAP